MITADPDTAGSKSTDQSAAGYSPSYSVSALVLQSTAASWFLCWFCLLSGSDPTLTSAEAAPPSAPAASYLTAIKHSVKERKWHWPNVHMFWVIFNYYRTSLKASKYRRRNKNRPWIQFQVIIFTEQLSYCLWFFCSHVVLTCWGCWGKGDVSRTWLLHLDPLQPWCL